MKFFILFIVPFVVSINANQQYAPANILASGNNKFVLPVLIQSFCKKYPDARVVVQYGATGDLAHSILDGVNYDIFLAADMKFPQMIYDAHKALNPPKEYSRGSIILFVPADKTLHQKKLEILKDKKINSIRNGGYGNFEKFLSFKIFRKKDKILHRYIYCNYQCYLV